MPSEKTIERGSDAHAWLGLPPEAVGPFARAVVRGFDAPDLGEAFYEGYQAALDFAFAAPDAAGRGSFCVTEAGGGHPRAIVCRLERGHADGAPAFVLNGEKTFVTGAPRATTLWVVAREGEREDGTPRLRVVRVSRPGPESPWPTGVTMTALPSLPFASAIEHAVVRFESVVVADRPDTVLAGDGYLRFVRPFRTIEDLHVMAAIAAHLVATVRTLDGAEARVEGWLSVIAALSALAERARRDSGASGLHLALAGTLARMRADVEGLEAVLAQHDDPDRASALLGDLALLRVAEGARRARRDNAWKALRGG